MERPRRGADGVAERQPPGAAREGKGPTLGRVTDPPGSLRSPAARIAVLATVAAALVVGLGAPAFAASFNFLSRGRTPTPAPTPTPTPTGNDISYPQCGRTFPSSPAFGIVGVNDGLPNDQNPCLAPSPSYAQSELYWAVALSTGATRQPKASLFVNTADPGDVYDGSPISDWPTSGTTPYGSCATTSVKTTKGTSVVGANSTACAWQYGDNKAQQDILWLSGVASAIDAQSPPIPVPGSAGSYPWWLDVETANTWQSGTAGLAMNVADLQGMVAAFRQAGASTIGAYSDSSQWDEIAGRTTSASGSLDGLPDWVPGAATLSGAVSNCALPSFTGGAVAITQWTGSSVDSDYAC
jgi:hypothetical protein